jgi:hypothetical protein
MRLLIKDYKLTPLGWFIALLFGLFYVPLWILFHPKEFWQESLKPWFKE